MILIYEAGNMTRIVQIKKKQILIYIIFIPILSIVSVMLIGQMKDRNKRETISGYEAARILVLGMSSEEEILSLDSADACVNAVNIRGCCKIKDGQAQMTYGNLKEIYLYFTGDIPSVIKDIKDRKVIARKQFVYYYQQLKESLPFGNELAENHQTVAGIKKIGEQTYEIYTANGKYQLLTNDMSLCEDQIYTFLMRGKNIVLVMDQVNTETNGIENQEVEYHNVLLMNCSSRNAQINLYGYVRTFEVKGLDDSLKNVLCDIRVLNGKIINVDLKMDTITGKVLSITEEYIDIEGYGHVTLDSAFLMYDSQDYANVSGFQDIIVGYALQDFVVAQGKLCGAVKEQQMNAVNIRVMLMTTGYQSLFHENVVISSTEGFSINTEEGNTHYNGGEEVLFSAGDENVSGKRVRIIPDGTNKLVVKSMSRSQGNPEYSGTLEVESYEEGLVLINDVNIEEYISHVIPSEMPTSFGLEALKVQAVCARSYAYKELTNTKYSMYGAHVDDSIQYQVYNNTGDQVLAQQAAEETKGQLLMYQEDVVQTYYYSTSCGVTTDVSLWGSQAEDYPYYKSVSVGTENHVDVTASESEFYNFITTVYESDYDREFPLYRWNMTVDVDMLGESIGNKTGNAIGSVRNICVNHRTSGGAADSVTITGTSGEITLNRESDIRTDLGNGNIDLNTQNGTTRYERLPSSFITFAPVYNDAGALTAYTIFGGGYGHGIGMSQNAVKQMSQTMNYVDILKFFYQGTEVKVRT